MEWNSQKAWEMILRRETLAVYVLKEPNVFFQINIAETMKRYGEIGVKLEVL